MKSMETLGEAHPDLAYSYNNLGMLLNDTGDKKDAVEHLQKALNLFEKALGSDHPNTKTVRGNLEGILREMGE